MFIVRHLLSHGAPWRTIYLQGIDNAEIIEAVHTLPSADDPSQRIAPGLTPIAATR
jgi:hypothetical protein